MSRLINPHVVFPRGLVIPTAAGVIVAPFAILVMPMAEGAPAPTVVETTDEQVEPKAPLAKCSPRVGRLLRVVA